ncbi:phosphoglycerate mutase family protein [Neobacillus cucumis]|uniref:histidine phosphatase family protein n=1 Tax=Neobacillus cucumis TaxID=1740721 RepID=UPI002E2192D6|nr:phosphoglycerate mutase family protein [Neobacillus cucumis]
MIITLIRHLPTEWNQKTWLQGRRDIDLAPVTEEFVHKINLNKALLEKQRFDLVLASTLKRTHQTANAYGFKPETEGLLDELDFGPYEGVPKKKLLEEYGDRWIENPREIILGESLKNLEARIESFLKKYKDYKHVLVFGHGSWIRGIVSYISYGDINRMNQIVVENNQCITLEWVSE